MATATTAAPADIATTIRTATDRDAVLALAAGLKGRRLQAVADALGIHLYGTADNKRRLIVQFGYDMRATSAVLSATTLAAGNTTPARPATAAPQAPARPVVTAPATASDDAASRYARHLAGRIGAMRDTIRLTHLGGEQVDTEARDMLRDAARALLAELDA